MITAIQPYNANYYAYNKISFGVALPKENILSEIFAGKTEMSANECLSYLSKLYLQNNVINFAQLQKLGIPNLQLVYNRGVRGATLSSPQNTKFMPAIKRCGIDTIIDLRVSDYTHTYKEKCDEFGFKYFHLPIDKKNTPDREILDKLPTFLKLIERGKFYIACAMGKHRTDIALAINYAFNPRQKEPPLMSGHTRNYVTDMEDINRRLNSLYRALTPEDKLKLGWTEDYEKEFWHKIQVLKSYSEMK